VNSGQLFRLEKELWKVHTRIAVWDKVDLILHIFDKHATSAEAKLQIELARIQHLGPRTYGLGGTVLSRQGGGIGTRGIGETNIERERRTAKKRMQKIKEELETRMKNRESLIEKRKRLGVHTIAIVGYTSAGKTTLFNHLTQRSKEMNKSLFTTLDTVVGRIRPRNEDRPIVISDTIGFIEDLPPSLIDAFRSTLFEALHAEVLVHVIDSFDPFMERKIQVVKDILSELSVTQEPILVFNKIDLISDDELAMIEKNYHDSPRMFISAKRGTGLKKLQTKLLSLLFSK
jgi:GTP-binding protein HflX